MQILIIILIMSIIGCAGEARKQRAATADTTKVIELALKTVMTEPFPELDGIKRKSAFGDSVFLTTSLLPLSTLPGSVDSFHFKVIADSSICSAIKTDTASEELPNYLKLQAFQQTDSGYLVEFQSIDCVPSPSRDGAVSIRILKTQDKYEFRNK